MLKEINDVLKNIDIIGKYSYLIWRMTWFLNICMLYFEWFDDSGKKILKELMVNLFNNNYLSTLSLFCTLTYNIFEFWLNFTAIILLVYLFMIWKELRFYEIVSRFLMYFIRYLIMLMYVNIWIISYLFIMDYTNFFIFGLSNSVSLSWYSINIIFLVMDINNCSK